MIGYTGPLALVRRWPTLTPEQRSDKWMFGVVHRCVMAKLRQNRPYVSFDDAGVDMLELAAPADAGETPTEATELLDVGTVNTHIRLATDQLRAAFARAGFRIEHQPPPRLLAPKEGSRND